MKLALLISLIASASAFAPAKQAASSSTALKAFEDEIGVTPPVGFFDPLGLLNGADQEKFERLRFVELKHGRICMLGFLGQITTRYGIHFEAPIDKEGHMFADYPNGLAALFGPNSIDKDRFWEIVLFVGWLELFVMKDIEGTGNQFVGDFRNGFIDFGWNSFSPEAKVLKRNVELNQGRAAMMGLLGLMVHEKLNEIGMVADLPIIGVLK